MKRFILPFLLLSSLAHANGYREEIVLSERAIKRDFEKDDRAIRGAIATEEFVDSDEVPEALKVLYWNLFNGYADILKTTDDRSAIVTSDHQNFLSVAKILGELEYQERKVDKTIDTVAAHLQYLEDKVYRFTKGLFLQYVSWQQNATLTGPSGDSGLIITNRGFCTGGEAGLENHLFHFYLDGCFLYGAGGVKNVAGNVDYQQSNLPAYGFKGGPGASMIVSSSKSRIGIKLPILYSRQDLEEPDAAGYSVSGESEVSVLATLYSRWQFGTWHFNTEFGKHVRKEGSFWGLGFGKTF